MDKHHETLKANTKILQVGTPLGLVTNWKAQYHNHTKATLELTFSKGTKWYIWHEHVTIT
jgi:hypothetical protein